MQYLKHIGQYVNIGSHGFLCAYYSLHFSICSKYFRLKNYWKRIKTQSLNSHVSYGMEFDGHLFPRILHDNFPGTVMNLLSF